MLGETNGRTPQRPPSADVYLTQHAVLVELEVPGFANDDIVVVAADRVVTVSGQRGGGGQGRHYLLRERGPTAFRREFHLPVGVDTEDLTVNMVDGVVTLRARRVEHVRPASAGVDTRGAAARPRRPAIG